jgi:16S rRNA (uracil1498-N3)-methyltransferase
VKARRAAVSGLAEGRVSCDERTSRYLARVLRLGMGDPVVAFDPAVGLEGEGEIVAVSARGLVTLEIRGLTRPGPPPVSLRLVQCVGKGTKLDAVVRDATELGVAIVQPVTSARTVVERESDQVHERLVRVAIEAARQCGRADIPRIEPTRTFEEAVAADFEGLGLTLHPRAEERLVDVVRASRARAFSVLIGPEGGLEDGEIELARSRAYRTVRFGWTTLRTETAATAVLGALVALCDGVGCDTLPLR